MRWFCSVALVARPNPQPAPTEQRKLDGAILRLENELSKVEATARTKGHGDYIDRTRETYRMWVSAELHSGCQPDEGQAMQRAKRAI